MGRTRIRETASGGFLECSAFLGTRFPEPSPATRLAVARFNSILAANRLRHALRLYRFTRYAALLALVPVLLCGDGATTLVLFALSALFLLAVSAHAWAGAGVASARANRRKNLQSCVPVSATPNKYTYNNNGEGVIVL